MCQPPKCHNNCSPLNDYTNLGEVLQLESLALRPVEVVAHGQQHGEDGREGAGAAQGLNTNLKKGLNCHCLKVIYIYTG